MFKVGDRVRIKPNANKIRSAGLGFNTKMLEYLGKEYLIRACEYDNRYKLEDVHQPEGTIQSVNSDGYWLWAEEWLEPAQETPIKEITNNDFDEMFQ